MLKVIGDLQIKKKNTTIPPEFEEITLNFLLSVHKIGMGLICTYVTVYDRVPLNHTVKNNRNFTDRVMGNCDKKSTVNREFTGKCPYILYINGQFTVLLQIVP